MEEPQVTSDEEAPSALELAERLREVQSAFAASPLAEMPLPDQAFRSSPEPPVTARYEAVRLADVVATRTRWLWPRRMPLGKLVTLDGDPDVGKSMLCCDLAARVTTGRPLPGEKRPAVPASPVVVMAAEDGLADTIRPRLDAAGADLERVHSFQSVPVWQDGRRIGSAPPTLPDDVAALEELVTDSGAVLVIVDVLMAYLSGAVNSWSDHGMRRALAPLAEMAERTGVCVVLLRHFPKSQRQAGQPIAAGSGSMGIIGLARAGMIAGLDPTDPEGRRRVLARSKGNLAGHWRSLAYKIAATEDGVPVVHWLGETGVSSSELLAAEQTDEERSTLDELTEWVTLVLDHAGGQLQFRDLLDLATKEGFSRGQLDRARKRLLAAERLVVMRDKGTSGAPATWRLTPSDDAAEST